MDLSEKGLLVKGAGSIFGWKLGFVIGLDYE